MIRRVRIIRPQIPADLARGGIHRNFDLHLLVRVLPIDENLATLFAHQSHFRLVAEEDAADLERALVQILRQLSIDEHLLRRRRRARLILEVDRIGQPFARCHKPLSGLVSKAYWPYHFVGVNGGFGFGGLLACITFWHRTTITS